MTTVVATRVFSDDYPYLDCMQLLQRDLQTFDQQELDQHLFSRTNEIERLCDSSLKAVDLFCFRSL